MKRRLFIGIVRLADGWMIRCEAIAKAFSYLVRQLTGGAASLRSLVFAAVIRISRLVLVI
jgi:hypothetical protein